MVRRTIIKKLQRINAGEGVEKREPAYTVGGNVNWNIHCGEHYGTKLKIELPFEHAQWCLTTRLLCPWDSPGKITGVGCHSLLQGIFPTQGSSLHFLCLLQAGGFFTTESLGKPQTTIWRSNSTTGSMRFFPDNARGCQCPFVMYFHPQGCLRRDRKSVV